MLVLSGPGEEVVPLFLRAGCLSDETGKNGFKLGTGPGTGPETNPGTAGLLEKGQ